MIIKKKFKKSKLKKKNLLSCVRRDKRNGRGEKNRVIARVTNIGH